MVVGGEARQGGSRADGNSNGEMRGDSGDAGMR